MKDTVFIEAKYTRLSKVFWVVTPCSVTVGYKRFRGLQFLAVGTAYLNGIYLYLSKVF
jgi:hypothetical protein